MPSQPSLPAPSLPAPSTGAHEAQDANTLDHTILITVHKSSSCCHSQAAHCRDAIHPGYVAPQHQCCSRHGCQGSAHGLRWHPAFCRRCRHRANRPARTRRCDRRASASTGAPPPSWGAPGRGCSRAPAQPPTRHLRDEPHTSCRQLFMMLLLLLLRRPPKALHFRDSSSSPSCRLK